ncbi:MAG: hypothetical protein WA182_07385 [Candidatus Sulfotelmatobacter sp.]
MKNSVKLVLIAFVSVAVLAIAAVDHYQEDKREMKIFCSTSTAALDKTELTVADTLAIVEAKAAEPDPSLSPEQRAKMLRFIASEKQSIAQERHDACYSSSLSQAKAATQEDLAKDMSTMTEMSAYLTGGGPMTQAQQLSFDRAYAKRAAAGGK